MVFVPVSDSTLMCGKWWHRICLAMIRVEQCGLSFGWWQWLDFTCNFFNTHLCSSVSFPLFYHGLWNRAIFDSGAATRLGRLTNRETGQLGDRLAKRIEGNLVVVSLDGGDIYSLLLLALCFCRLEEVKNPDSDNIKTSGFAPQTWISLSYFFSPTKLGT